LFAEGVEATLADFVGGALGDHEGALPIVFAIEQDHQSAAIDVAEGLAGSLARRVKTHPHYIHGGAEIYGGQTCSLANDGVTAIGSDNEIARELRAGLAAW